MSYSEALYNEKHDMSYKPLKSIKTLRDENVIKQGYDYSCGASALATLMTYGLNHKIAEKEIMSKIMETVSKDKEKMKKKEGFSLLDMQTITTFYGYKALGFRIEPEYLPQLNGPVIVFIKPRDYPHFAVLKGIHGDRIYLADPSLGNIRMPAYKFLDMWLDKHGQGIIFVVEPKNARWSIEHPLQVKNQGYSQPEMMTVRQLLEVKTPFLRFPELAR